MRDLSPAEMTVFRRVEGTCRDICSHWGYQEVRTPTIEYLHLFTSAGTLTPGRLGKVYSFLDWDGWSGERVVLRPDGTIPVARMYTESLQGLARLFYAANIFIFEEAGDKRRERWQCGAELIGAGSAMADAELISLSLEVLKKLGLKNVELRLSHAGLIKPFLQGLEPNPEEQQRILDRILDGDLEALAKFDINLPDDIDNLWPSSGISQDQKSVIKTNLAKLPAPLADFTKTTDVLDKLGIKYKTNFPSGAGFEYYTGIIFQLFIGREKVGGGGRYDALIPSMGGGDVPASGFALYLDQLVSLVKPEFFVKRVPERVLVRVKSGGSTNEAFRVADILRKAGYIAELDLDGKETDLKWVIEVRSKAPIFVLVNVGTKKKIEASTVNEVLKRLEGEGGD